MKLFQPIQIYTLELKNRIIMAPMATHFADEAGAVTDRLKNYYAERARGGTGLIMIESG
jgi:2,4-dienoyl-CoA reductase-like NADH-dependent reductase (Old Yellow Enzyme family)